MPPLESKHERILDTLETLMRSIDAVAEPAKYWNTVGVVTRPDDFNVDNLVAAKGLNVEILPGDESPEQRTTGTQLDHFEVWILASQPWKPNSRNPHAMLPPRRQTLQNRLLSDIKVKLGENLTLSNLVVGLRVAQVSRAPMVAGQFPWIQVELLLDITYHHQLAKPWQ